MFELNGDNETTFSKNLDPSMLLKLNQPMHLTILKQRRNERKVVIGTKNVEWRHLLAHNSIEVNAEVLPVSLHQQGTLGLV